MCRAGLLKQPKTPVPLDSDPELSGPPKYGDCEQMGGWIQFLGVLPWFLFTLGYARLICIALFVAYRVKKNGGIKPNSATIALLCIPIEASGHFFACFQYFLVRANLDRKQLFWDFMYEYSHTVYGVAGNIIALECVVTWFDLYEKSANLSKRSSNITFGLRIFIRLCNVFSTTWLIIGAMEIFPKSFWNTGVTMSIWIPMCFIVLFAPLITRTLCKDMKDVTNPNWKAAAAIRNVAKHAFLCRLFSFLGLELLWRQGLWAHMATINNHVALVAQHINNTFMIWAWFQYILFASRRYLKDEDHAVLYKYFGLGYFSRLRDGSTSQVSNDSISALTSASKSVAE